MGKNKKGNKFTPAPAPKPAPEKTNTTTPSSNPEVSQKAESQETTNTSTESKATSSGVITKKIMIMASMDWSMRHAMRSFYDFMENPILTWEGKKYQLKFDRIIAKPLLCGSDLRPEADLIVDRTIHWNDYYKCWAQQALNCQMSIVNHTHTFANLDKHSTYDMMARAIHPEDHFPTTVLLPQFSPWSPEQKADDMWKYEQGLIVDNTDYGWDPHRRKTNWEKVQQKLSDAKRHIELNDLLRDQFYAKGSWLEDCVRDHFGNQFPLFLKKSLGGGGSDVYKIKDLQDLYEKYDRTNGRAFHLQEAVENYEVFIRCMGIGPQVLPMEFLPDKPLHEHYSPAKLKVDKKLFSRLYHYVLFINSYHRWTYNSYESIVKDGKIHPIDFANACPDSNFTSLHTHFPWLICALVKWFAFCAVTDKDMGIDLEHTRYVEVLNNPNLTQLEKYEQIAQMSEEYFEIEKFNQFCEENFKDIDQRMIRFYDEGHYEPIIKQAIMLSSFPEYEYDRFIREYSDMMKNTWRPNAQEYLTTVVYR